MRILVFTRDGPRSRAPGWGSGDLRSSSMTLDMWHSVRRWQNSMASLGLSCAY